MKILPFDYAVRNLGRSRLRLTLSVAGSALVVMLVIGAAAFVRSMGNSLVSSASPDNVILLGAGSEESIERSEISATVPTQLTGTVPGIRSQLNVPFVSPEVHMALAVGTRQGEASHQQVVVRGVTHTAYAVHPQVRITSGRAPRPGNNEIMVGRLAHTRIGLRPEALAIGNHLWFDDQPWEIVGHFQADRTVMDAEIWTALSDLMIAAKRSTISCVVVTLDEATFADIDAFAKSRLDLELVAMREMDYYNQLSAFYKPVMIMVWVTAGLIALGGLFGGLNTMYAAFSARVREVGMLQALGFARRAIVLSLVQESMLAAAAGAIIAAGLCLLLFDGVSVRFAMGAFGLRMDAVTLMLGLVAGLLLGFIGALPPAWRCLRLPIAEALKAA